MDKYILKFGDVPYSDIHAVESGGVFSTHKAARKLERQLKKENPDFKEIWPQIQKLPPDERQYLTACLCAWSYSRAFDQAFASGQLPSEIFLAQDSGDYEFGDQYYTYKMSPIECRQSALEHRASYHKRQAEEAEFELKRLERNPPQVMATVQSSTRRSITLVPVKATEPSELDDIPF